MRSFDNTDRAILEQLQLNGRISMRKLGEAVHLSSPAVTERVKRLEDSGVIERYTARINPAAMGLKVEASIIVMLQNGKKNEFLRFIKEESEIITANETPGKSDALLTVYCQNIERFFSLISRIRKYGATDSYVHMENYKDSIFLPEIE